MQLGILELRHKCKYCQYWGLIDESVRPMVDLAVFTFWWRDGQLLVYPVWM